MAIHLFNVRICYCDTDAGGVVYHANYLRMMECARMDWLASMGLLPSQIQELFGVFFISKMDIKFIRPLFLEDSAEISTEILAFEERRVKLRQTFKKLEKVTTVSNVWIALVKDGKSVSFPDPILEKFKKYQNGKNSN